MVTNPYLLKNTNFVDAIAVVYLRCNKKAVVSGGQVSDTVGFENAIQFNCTHCGYAIKYANTPKFSVFTIASRRVRTKEVQSLYQVGIKQAYYGQEQSY